MNQREEYIAGRKTRTDWFTLRSRLRANAAGAWDEALREFFMARLTTRYLTPIDALQSLALSQGEGFSIVAIQCSLIEFLQSTFEGVNYRYNGADPAKYEYGKSSRVFKAFLRNQKPFSSTFVDEASAESFYTGVRCGLLHEARTKDRWRILKTGPKGCVADVKNRLVFRDNFQEGLIEYASMYGARLRQEVNLQEAFIRKFDDLCN